MKAKSRISYSFSKGTVVVLCAVWLSSTQLQWHRLGLRAIKMELNVLRRQKSLSADVLMGNARWELQGSNCKHLLHSMWIFNLHQASLPLHLYLFKPSRNIGKIQIRRLLWAFSSGSTLCVLYIWYSCLNFFGEIM